MPMVINSPIVDDWKSLLSNFSGTNPVPTTGRSLQEEGVVGRLVIWGVEDAAAAVAVTVKGIEGGDAGCEGSGGRSVCSGNMPRDGVTQLALANRCM